MSQNGCEFELVTESGSTSVDIPEGNTLITYTLSMGGHKVRVSDCRMVDNPDQLHLHVAHR